MQKQKNQKTHNQTGLKNRDLNEPIVIYDEDNLIVDDFIIAKQRPQSGRVNRQRPLSGKVSHITHNPTTHQLNKRASIQYNNKFIFQC